MPIVIRNDESAPAATSSSRSTSRGVSASSDGRCRPSSVASRADITNSTHSWGCGRSAFPTSTSDAAANESSVTCIIRRRSKASASAPPMNAAARSGASSASPSSPTTSEEPLSW